MLALTIIVCVAVNFRFALAREAQPSADIFKAFQNCLDGKASADDAKIVGETIGSQGNEVTFDERVFAPSCADKIFPFLFSTYSEAVSLQLVSFFWRPEFLARLYDVSAAPTQQPTCDLTCFLLVDRRDLPDLSTFKMLEAKPLSQDFDAQALLLARTMFVSPTLDVAQVSAVVHGVLDQKMRQRLILFSYFLGSAAFLNGHYHYTNDAVCLSDICAAVEASDDNLDCTSFHGELNNAKTIERLVSLKRWVMTSGKSKVEACAVDESKTPFQAEHNSILTDLFQLSVFDTSLGLPDVENNSRSGTFKHFDFIDSDISRIDNIDFSKLNALTSSFSRRIVEQLAADPSRVSYMTTSDRRAFPELFMQETARLRYLICTMSQTRIRGDCDLSKIYLTEISNWLHLRRGPN